MAVGPRRRPLIGLTIGLLALLVGSLHGTGAAFANDSPSTLLLAGGVSGLVIVFATCASLPTEQARKITVYLFATSVLAYVPWLVYAIFSGVRVPSDAVSAALTGILVAALAATITAATVLALHRVELVLGWHDPPEKRLLSDDEYRTFVDGNLDGN